MDDAKLIYRIGTLFTELQRANADGHLNGEHEIQVNDTMLQVYIQGMEVAFCTIPDNANTLHLGLGVGEL
jgi:hypothetical protein